MSNIGNPGGFIEVVTSIYRNTGQKAEYIRQIGFSELQNESMILSYIGKHGKVKRSEVMSLCHLDAQQAYRMMKKLIGEGKLVKNGKKRHAFYTRNA